MNKISSFNLIEGEFSASEAQEILLGLIEYKIQFHNLKVFGSEVKSGKKDVHSLERIKQLRATRDSISKLLQSENVKNLKLSIHSTVNIETES